MSSVVQLGLDLKSRKLDMQIALKSRIANRHAKVGIIGLGYVGLPLAQVFVRAGYKMLVPRQCAIDGYRRCSFLRAFCTVKRHWIVAWAALRRFS
jgi:hypothetical protein